MKAAFKCSMLYCGVSIALGCATFLSAPGKAVQAAGYPERVITLVVPYAAGGPTDIMGRQVADFLSKDLKQPVIVENKPGAQGAIGASAVARSAPDGYTLFMAAGSIIVLNPLLYKSLSYDPAKDFRMLSLLTEVPVVMEVNPSVPAKGMAEFIDYAKKNPGKLNFGSAGVGGTLHLAGEMFKYTTGVDMNHVPYKGAAPALTELVGGQIEVMFDTLSTSLPYIKSGNLRALALASRERVKELPDVPTAAEAGVPDFRVTVWYGVAVPAKLPEDITVKLTESLDRAAKDPAFRETLEKIGFVVQQPRSPTEIGKYIDEDRALWTKVIDAQKIKLD